jgi:hypothetical protein
LSPIFRFFYVVYTARYLNMCNFKDCESKMNYLFQLWNSYYARIQDQGVSEWLLLQLYHVENKLIFNEMMIRSTLYWTNTLSWIFIMLAQWNNSPGIDICLPHSDTLSWFRATQSLLFLLNAACLAEKQQPDQGEQFVPNTFIMFVFLIYLQN